MKKYIKLLLLIGWMAVIFMFSSEDAQMSSNTSNIVIEFVYNLISNIFSLNYSLDEFLLEYAHLFRKLAHFTEFFILGFLAYINIKDMNNKYLYISIAFCVLYAISDEIHQLFVQNRACSIIDMCIDSSGSILAIVLCHLIYSRCIKKQS